MDTARVRAEYKTSHGLVIAIVKNLAERQGCKITLKSTMRNGVEFGIEI